MTERALPCLGTVEATGSADLGWGTPREGECRPDQPSACMGPCESDGNGQACFYLASSLGFGIGFERDPECAASVAAHGCDELGSLTSCSFLGSAYFRGNGVPVDLERAEDLLTLPCQQGVPMGCVELAAVWLEQGERNDEAVEMLERVCALEQGYATGCHSLAVIHEAGEIVEHNGDRAAELFRRACDGGFRPSCAMDEPGGDSE